MEAVVFVLWEVIALTPRATIWAVDRLIGRNMLPARLARQPSENLYVAAWMFHAVLVASVLLLAFAAYPAWWMVPPGSVVFYTAPIVMLLWAALAAYRRIPSVEAFTLDDEVTT